jgi:hypothetical protein
MKINQALEESRILNSFSSVEFKISGKHGLSDISLLNNLLIERFKQFSLSSEVKSYSMDSSVIIVKSTLSSDVLLSTLSKDGGKYPLNEQKILLFNPSTKTFAIIPN